METVKFPSLKILILTLKKRAAPNNRAAHFVYKNFCFLFLQPQVQLEQGWQEDAE